MHVLPLTSLRLLTRWVVSMKVRLALLAIELVPTPGVTGRRGMVLTNSWIGLLQYLTTCLVDTSRAGTLSVLLTVRLTTVLWVRLARRLLTVTALLASFCGDA